MSDSPRCRATVEVLPELGLDILTGEERARALHHLAACAACRRSLSELREVSEDLLLLVPPREPPAGFESRVLEQVGGRLPGARPSRWRRVLVPAVAALVAAGVAAGGVYLAMGEERELAGHYRDALEQGEGRYFGGIALHDEGRRRVGTVFGYEGAPTWMVVVVDAPTGTGELEVVLVTREGERVPVGAMELADGSGSWGRAIPTRLREVAEVRLVHQDGGSVFRALLPAADREPAEAVPAQGQRTQSAGTAASSGRSSSGGSSGAGALPLRT